MDGYPLGSLDHDVPLVIFSGLTSKASEIELDATLREDTTLLRSDQPPLDSKEAEILEQYFQHVDKYGKKWTPVSRDEPYRLRTKSVGRTYALPSTRASLPKDAEPTRPNPVLHSPFSPLSPASSLYPDGLMNVKWIQKHQELVPAVFACCYSLTNDPSAATLQDNRLKMDINNIKTALIDGGYKTRLAVIFVQRKGDGSSPSITDQISERLEKIRKGTSMEPKSMFYIHPQDSPSDLKGIANSILATLYGTAIEYYRDLGRHARKKRSRGLVPQPTVPPTSGTSQTLSLPDWNFRYDFKIAIFSEFRQEWDPAIRSFEQAYEILLGQDVMDTIPSWSPRWNEARLLADIIAIRCLRLDLWMNQPSLAVRRWQAHRDRIGDFVDRRGRGTNNYGWQAWEARWALVMAQLIEKVEVPGLVPSTMNLYLPPEKAVLGERLYPWEHLHHTGYWYRIAARHIGARRTLALMIPDEDRAPPSGPNRQSSQRYDTYLCPPPYKEYPIEGDGVNHAQLIIDSLIAARTQYQGRKQLRIAAELSLECAREMSGLEAWQDVLAMLRPLWEDLSFRGENWVDISEELCWLMRRAAVAAGRGELVVAIDWELLDKKFTRRPHWHYDLGKSLEGMKMDQKPTVNVSNTSATGFISSSFVFRNRESKAGDFCKAQLSLMSNAMPGSAPITLSNIRIEFEGSLKPITLEHTSSSEGSSTKSAVLIHAVTLDEEFSGDEKDDLPTKLDGRCDLTLQAGQRLVVEMAIPLREAGEVEPSCVVLNLETKAFDLSQTLPFKDTDWAAGWFSVGSSKARQVRADSRTLSVLPRPPKLEIKLLGQRPQYYANETIVLDVVLQNNEDEAATTKLDVEAYGKVIPILKVESSGKEHATEAQVEGESMLSGISLGRIDSSSSREFVLTVDPAKGPTVYEIQLRATYHLETDSATPIIQVLSMQLNLVNPFEANYDLVPRLHPEPWPSLFNAEGLDDIDESGKQRTPIGLIQRWCLMSHYASFAQEDVRVMDTDVQVTECVGGARCSIRRLTQITETDGLLIEPKRLHEAQFEIDAQKMQLEDRSGVSMELAFKVQWRRADSRVKSAVNTTIMPVGRYLVLGSEPRVLATVGQGQGDETSTMQLGITIENPSNHLLTFGLTMDPSDEFAFSGSKQTTLHMLPMSRRTATYNLLPLKRGAWIRPGLVVRDKYFQKMLRIIPTEDMKVDKDGLLVWVAGLGDDDEPEKEDPEDGV